MDTSLNAVDLYSPEIPILCKSFAQHIPHTFIHFSQVGKELDS